MEEDQLRSWVEDKLEKGYSSEDLKEILREKGYSSEIVDEVISSPGLAADEEPERDSEPSEISGPAEESDYDYRSGQEESSVSIGDKSSDIDEVQERVSRFSGKLAGGWKIYLGVLSLVVLVVAAGALIYMGDLNNVVASSSSSDRVNTGSGAGDPDRNQVKSDSSNSVKVEFRDGMAVPSRPRINSSRDVMFVNSHSYDLKLHLGRRSVEIPAESSKVLDINTVTYYSAKPVNSSAESIQGSIYVE